MSEEELRAIRERCEAASVGPWEVVTEAHPLNEAGLRDVPKSAPLVERHIQTAPRIWMGEKAPVVGHQTSPYFGPRHAFVYLSAYDPSSVIYGPDYVLCGHCQNRVKRMEHGHCYRCGTALPLPRGAGA